MAWHRTGAKFILFKPMKKIADALFPTSPFYHTEWENPVPGTTRHPREGIPSWCAEKILVHHGWCFARTLIHHKSWFIPNQEKYQGWSTSCLEIQIMWTLILIGREQFKLSFDLSLYSFEKCRFCIHPSIHPSISPPIRSFYPYTTHFNHPSHHSVYSFVRSILLSDLFIDVLC